MELTKEFREGIDAPQDGDCPYIATSNCADAWWLGRRWHDSRFLLMRGDHRLDNAKVTKGRGYLLNIISASGNGKLVAKVNWESPSFGGPYISFA